MSVQSEINRLKSNISNSFAAVAEMGGTVTAGENSDDLAAAILTISSGGGAAAPMPTFTYSVEDGYEIETDEETGVWKIRFLTSGVLVFTSEPPLIDIWGCGGGGGTAGHDGIGATTGGGGYISAKMRYQPVINKEYTITIGKGGSAGSASGNGGRGGTSSAFGVSAVGGYGGAYSSGYGGDGGSGGNGYMSNAYGATNGADGKSYSGYIGGTGQKITTREFFEENGILYASGGATNSTGAAGAANTGNGGGMPKSSAAGKGTAGGSGIVIIRGSTL